MRRKIAILLALILLSGFLIRFLPARTGYHYWDETVYLQHGEIIAGKHVDNYNEFDFRPPFLSLVVGGVSSLTDSLVLLHLVISIISSAGILLVFLLGSRLYNEEVGIVSSLVYSVSPEQVWASHMVLVDSILPVFWLATAILLLFSLESGRSRAALLSGAFAGLAVLSKFTSLVLLPLGIFLLWTEFMRKEELSPEGLSSSFGELTRDGRAWGYLLGSFAVLSPYLLWNSLSFGSFSYPFEKALQLSGASSPFLEYLEAFPQLFPLPFALGFLLLKRENLGERNFAFLALFFLSLFIPLQFFISNREVRYLLPVLPFLAILAASGLERVRNHEKELYVFTVILLFAFSLPFLVSGKSYVRPLLSGNLVLEEDFSPTYDAAVWMRENTPEESLLYTNYEWTILAYHSHREIRFMPVGRPFQEDLSRYMNRTGYVFHTDRAPDDYEPTLDFMLDDPRFEINRTFGNDTRIFYFMP